MQSANTQLFSTPVSEGYAVDDISVHGESSPDSLSLGNNAVEIPFVYYGQLDLEPLTGTEYSPIEPYLTAQDSPSVIRSDNPLDLPTNSPSTTRANPGSNDDSDSDDDHDAAFQLPAGVIGVNYHGSLHAYPRFFGAEVHPQTTVLGMLLNRPAPAVAIPAPALQRSLTPDLTATARTPGRRHSL